MFYETLFTQLKALIESVDNVKEAFYTPKQPTKFPCVFFKPTGFSNSFETQNENFMVYRFSAFVIISCNQNTQANVFGSILPKTVDAIVAKFADSWNGGVIGGHRVWTKIESADEWYISQDQDGLMAVAPLNIDIRLLVDTN